MKISTSGFAVNGLKAGDAIATLVSLRPKDEKWQPETLTDDVHTKEWAGRLLEVKGFNDGVYLETEYAFTDGFLSSLSKSTGAVLHLNYYESMEGFGCSYFVDGQKVLERLTVATGNMKDEHLTDEFNGIHTKEIIGKLFNLLTGGTLAGAEAMEKQETVHYIKSV